MKFYNRSEHPEGKPSTAGEKIEPTYEMTMDPRGHKILEQVGGTNIYERIQESLEETKIENIIRRAVGGDETALATMHGVYIDVTNAPTSLAEMQQVIIHATEEFYKLPLEIREKFDHSPEQYITEFGSEEWAKKLEQPKTLGQIQAETRTVEEVKAE